ncbi:MAG: hypothetical protein LBK82_08255 [Planctomycetaceae bacterium]|nr:hypothetical protein [Planctomycetaceae bacterium]
MSQELEPVEIAEDLIPSDIAVDDEVTANKLLLLEALAKNYGIIRVACRSVGIGTDQFYKYKKSDPNFLQAVDEIRARNLDFVEDQLVSNIMKGDVASIIFYLKCQGKNRGWLERSIIDNNLHIKTKIVFDQIDESS